MEPIVQIVIVKNSRGQYEVKLMSAERTIVNSAFASADDAEEFAAGFIPELVSVQ